MKSHGDVCSNSSVKQDQCQDCWRILNHEITLLQRSSKSVLIYWVNQQVEAKMKCNKQRSTRDRAFLAVVHLLLYTNFWPFKTDFRLHTEIQGILLSHIVKNSSNLYIYGDLNLSLQGLGFGSIFLHFLCCFSLLLFNNLEHSDPRWQIRMAAFRSWARPSQFIKRLRSGCVLTQSPHVSPGQLDLCYGWGGFITSRSIKVLCGSVKVFISEPPAPAYA